ncbi:hypothetical protein [Methylobacter sp.]|uniref:hypothetical protein n=1 Tax=Methylobacter sp. TaxID=2051955 RepID=UPI001224EBBC|nr:hypothetical protein [Methylobacter sp.]TAK65208.1 MAG: hypothetical protein EPO18_00420 [Methylobacter sp.]
MKARNFSGTLTVIASLLIGSIVTGNAIAEDSDYSFKVHNNTRFKMTKLLVSEDKKDWGYFDIGQGIAAGDSMMLVWDSSTNAMKVAINMLRPPMPTVQNPRRLNLIFAKLIWNWNFKKYASRKTSIS